MTAIEMEPEAGREMRSSKVKVWDIMVRIFHWSLVTSFGLAWLTAEDWDRAHEITGYAVAVLIGFRLMWGIVGSKHARFSDFVVRPSTLIAYIRDSMYNRARRYIGHNPAGGAMIIAMLVSLVVATASGIASVSDAYWGIEWMAELHEISATLTLGLVIMHVAGVIYSSRAHKENLVWSMITGKKRPLSD